MNESLREYLEEWFKHPDFKTECREKLLEHYLEKNARNNEKETNKGLR